MSTNNTIFNILKKITLNYPQSTAFGFFQGTQERVRNSCSIDEPSVFKPLKFYYNTISREVRLR